MKVFIPAELDVNKLIQRKPPVEVKNFSKDKLLYIVGSIAYMQTYRHDLKIGGEYVPVSSAYLQNDAGIRNYNAYLKYLVDAGVLKAINFVQGQHSTLYTLLAPYNRKTKAVTLTDKKFIKSLERDTRKDEAIKQFKNLWKWFAHGNLKIDREKALEHLHKTYPLNMTEEQKSIFLGDEYWPEEDLSAKHHRMARIIETVHEGDPEKLPFVVDQTAGRLHTVLTSMNREFRRFLTYGGKQLASVDVKCCQPYLTLLLFNSNFYKVKTRGLPAEEQKILKDLFNDVGAGQISMSSLSCSSLLGELVLSLMSLQSNEHVSVSVFPNISTLSSSITLVKEIQEGIEKGLYEDVGRYFQDILVKDFYTELSNAFNREYDDNTTREDIKEMWSMVAFGKIRAAKHASTPDFYRLFAQRYPTVLKLYDTIKAEKHQNLAYLLQQIEAHIVLKVASKRITKLKPRVPLFSIHDSLVTTVRHAEFVRSVMEEALHKLVGYRPKLKVEWW
ncbi:hypothetical protein H8S95_16785 [Pontibacter sp. KCTC 32443]|uniref:hypothetical protein n=1 Tax=Pontibacter TaxID=323449 RepID=UPI00164DC134|nr:MULTISPECIES: hypothetical protein [Pontibacter]MBC5775736.1 hypothetical protein [Pontibacter sp. KCTC 32443]